MPVRKCRVSGVALQITLLTALPAGGIWQLELICVGLSPFRLLVEVCWVTLSAVTLSRALPGASSSCSHPSLANTCHCQSQGDNTQMILSFGLIKSAGLFELQSLQQIIAALRCWPGHSLRDKTRLLLYEGFEGVFFCLFAPQLLIFLKWILHLNPSLAFLIQTNIVITYYLDAESSVLTFLCLCCHSRFHRGLPIAILNCHLNKIADLNRLVSNSLEE